MLSTLRLRISHQSKVLPVQNEALVQASRPRPDVVESHVRAGKVNRLKKRAVQLGKTTTHDEYTEAVQHIPKTRLSNVNSNPSYQVSPLIDTNFVNRRVKHIEPKPYGLEDETDFERAVTSNPYARLLAEPLRACQLTQVRLPLGFLIPTTLRKHPDTGHHWHGPEFERGRRSVTTYYLGSHRIIHQLSTLKPFRYMRSISGRWKLALTESEKRNIVVRKDLASFVLDDMRRATRIALDQAIADGDLVKDSNAEGPVLWFGEGNVLQELENRDTFNMKEFMGSLDLADTTDFLIMKDSNKSYDLFRWLTMIRMYLQP